MQPLTSTTTKVDKVYETHALEEATQPNVQAPKLSVQSLVITNTATKNGIGKGSASVPSAIITILLSLKRRHKTPISH